MTHLVQQGFRTTIKTLAGGLLLGTALSLSPIAALAQDAAAPPAEAPAAAAPAAEAPATAAPAAQAPAPSPDTVIATVGDSPITEADLNIAAQDVQQQLQQVPADQRRAILVNMLIDMKLMAKAARDAGLADSDDYKRRVQYLEDSALRREYFSEKIAKSIDDAAVKAAYDKYVADFKPADEIHARHILVATEEEAKAIKAELDAGKPFEVLAMEKTIDPSGKQNGGDLGFFSAGMMVPEFEQAAFALKPGEVSQPVKSQFGWHIIKVEETRKSSPAPMEQMQQQLGQQLMYAAIEKASTDLRAGVKVDIPDAALAAAVAEQQKPADKAEQGAAAP